MKLQRCLVVVVVCTASLAVRQARAQAPAPAPAPAAMPAQGVNMQPYADPQAHTHHGVFLRLMLGPAGFDTQATMGSDKFEVQGGGAGLGLAVGAAVTRNIVIYGEVFDDVAVGPTLKMNDQTVGTTNDNTAAGVVGFGPGIAYFFDSDFYVSTTFAASRIQVEQNNQAVAHSDTGFGVSAMVGKQWWVSDGWGAGLTAQLFVGSIPDGQANTSWSTAGAMLAFSATYH